LINHTKHNDMEQLTIGALCEIIKRNAPKVYNSITIDTAVQPKKYNYCYIEAHTQRVEFKTERRSAAIDENLAGDLRAIIDNSNTYVRIDKDLVDDFNAAPKFSTEGFFASTKKKMDELMNGGRSVDHHIITLDTEGDKLAKRQPPYAIKTECTIANCPNCKGSGLTESTDAQGNTVSQLCPECKGYKQIGTFAYFVPKIIEKNISLTLCLEGEIDGFPISAIKAHIDEKPVAKRMLTHINGIDNETFDSTLLPYLDIVRDKTGEGNAIEDYYFRIIPCYTFVYRNIMTGELKKGVVVNPNELPEIVLIGNDSTKIINRMKDSAKLVSRFFGSITGSAKRDKEDLKRTIRLLIATVVADGIVSEEEKQSLTLSIRNIDILTSKEREELAELLSAGDTSFLDDDDFKFHDADNRDETLARMQEIANCDGLVHETERDLIEKLKLESNA